VKGEGGRGGEGVGDRPMLQGVPFPDARLANQIGRKEDAAGKEPEARIDERRASEDPDGGPAPNASFQGMLGGGGRTRLTTLPAQNDRETGLRISDDDDLRVRGERQLLRRFDSLPLEQLG